MVAAAGDHTSNKASREITPDVSDSSGGKQDIAEPIYVKNQDAFFILHGNLGIISPSRISSAPLESSLG